ncbi:MAG: aromatic ring-hydroxylating dioxygenase subunit alpha [Rhabdochlamydiaceae bacterium]|nr:aromatic ring-hydroxylating dioxygenase subunit alpha [Candidatus Amphrikana amoebophyrae]
MNSVQNQCFPICYSSEVRNRPLGVQLFGDPIVLFRNSKGVIQALNDQCPHRGAPLSKGKVVGDEICCPYHGWTFGEGGKCCSIPGMDSGKTRSIHNVKSYCVKEQYGLVWVGSENCDSIPVIPELANSKYVSFNLDINVEVGLLQVIENVLDPMHTHYVHDGWIRSNSERSGQKVVISTQSNSIEVKYVTQDQQDGFIYKLLTLGRTVVESYGRFISPNTTQIEYKTDKNDHFLINGFISPINENHTRLFLVSTCKTKLPFSLMKCVVKKLFNTALLQDQKILTTVSKHKQKFKNNQKEVSTYLDMVGPLANQLLKGNSLTQKTKEILIYV